MQRRYSIAAVARSPACSASSAASNSSSTDGLSAYGQGEPQLAVQLGERLADAPREPAAVVARQLEPGERMSVAVFAGAPQPLGAAHDVRKRQAFAEQTGDLARSDQIPEAALRAARLDDVEQLEQAHHARLEAGARGQVVQANRAGARRQGRQQIQHAQQGVLAQAPGADPLGPGELGLEAAIGELLQAAPAKRDQRGTGRQPAPHDPAAPLDLLRDQRIGRLGEAADQADDLAGELGHPPDLRRICASSSVRRPRAPWRQACAACSRPPASRPRASA